MQTPQIKSFFYAFLFFFVMSTPAFADLTSGMEDLQSKVRLICTPLAIIFLIIAGWQKAMGNSQLFLAAVIGTIIMFAAPQIVSFISASFGGG
jgi:type IV secretory pathway VirB2 component (pilin)